jgi:hypothetical protein
MEEVTGSSPVSGIRIFMQLFRENGAIVTLEAVAELFFDAKK